MRAVAFLAALRAGLLAAAFFAVLPARVFFAVVFFAVVFFAADFLAPPFALRPERRAAAFMVFFVAAPAFFAFDFALDFDFAFFAMIVLPI